MNIKPENSNALMVIMPIVTIAMEIEEIINQTVQEGYNLSIVDFRILRPIHLFKSCTQTDIALFNHVTKAAVSKRIEKLIKLSLVKRIRDPNDTRKYILKLTEKGEKFVLQIFATMTKKIESILSKTPKQKQKDLSSLLFEILPAIIDASPRQEMLKKSKHPIINLLKKS